MPHGSFWGARNTCPNKTTFLFFPFWRQFGVHIPITFGESINNFLVGPWSVNVRGWDPENSSSHVYLECVDPVLFTLSKLNNNFKKNKHTYVNNIIYEQYVYIIIIIVIVIIIIFYYCYLIYYTHHITIVWKYQHTRTQLCLRPSYSWKARRG